MKLKSITIQNFRSYRNPTKIVFDDLTVLIGKNDIGKSTVLEALDVFFNDGKGVVKLDSGDINVASSKEGIKDVVISATFSELPHKVVLDEESETTLKNEYLLNSDGDLEIIKTFKGGNTTASSIKVSINALHPSNENCNALLSKKNADLKKIVENLNVSCEKNKNAAMRAAIWKHYEDELALRERELDVASKEGDIKEIWSKLNEYLPCYSLFQSDRKNSDSDSEVQDPLKEAVKQIFNDAELQEQLKSVAQKVRDTLQEVANLTLEKIKEMAPSIASSLHPKIPSSESLKWADVFKNLSISGDEDISINKRGSGVKRLILLNFFRAEAERRKDASKREAIIYAIEEPETSQHKAHQEMLVSALKSLSEKSGIQVVLTTHSSIVVKNLDFKNLRLIHRDETQGQACVDDVKEKILPYPSLNETNYIAFGDASEEFHNELYGFLQAQASNEDSDNERERPFDNWLERHGCAKTRSWIRIQNGVRQPQYPATLQTYIRNTIHHPENTANIKYTKEELKSSIEEMVKIVQSLSNSSV